MKRFAALTLAVVLCLGMAASPVFAGGFWTEVNFDKANKLCDDAYNKTSTESFVFYYTSRYCGICEASLPDLKKYAAEKGLGVYCLDAFNTLGGTTNYLQSISRFLPSQASYAFPILIVYSADTKKIAASEYAWDTATLDRLMAEAGYKVGDGTKGQAGFPALLVGGKAVQFTSSTGRPYIDANGRTQVPFRLALESYGATVEWDSASRTAIAVKNGITVCLPIGERYLFKDGVKQSIDTAALIKDGRTYLPIRPVIEALGGKVGWNGTDYTVTIE